MEIDEKGLVACFTASLDNTFPDRPIGNSVPVVRVSATRKYRSCCFTQLVVRCESRRLFGLSFMRAYCFAHSSLYIHLTRTFRLARAISPPPPLPPLPLFSKCISSINWQGSLTGCIRKEIPCTARRITVCL